MCYCNVSAVISEWFVLLCCQSIPVISALDPVTTVIPLAVVLGITAVKDLIDDIVSKLLLLYLSLLFGLC